MKKSLVIIGLFMVSITFSQAIEYSNNAVKFKTNIEDFQPFQNNSAQRATNINKQLKNYSNNFSTNVVLNESFEIAYQKTTSKKQTKSITLKVYENFIESFILDRLLHKSNQDVFYYGDKNTDSYTAYSIEKEISTAIERINLEKKLIEKYYKLAPNEIDKTLQNSLYILVFDF